MSGAPPEEPAVIYVVLGMHKSGTTLVSQTLHKSGVSMGPEFDEDGTQVWAKHFQPTARAKTSPLRFSEAFAAFGARHGWPTAPGGPCIGFLMADDTRHPVASNLKASLVRSRLLY